MTQWASLLKLEHADGQTPVNLNLSKATVILDSAARPIPLNLIGGGENVQGYHLIRVCQEVCVKERKVIKETSHQTQ
jgi:hypothetical protein